MKTIKYAVTTEILAAYMDGEVTRSEEAAIEAALNGSSEMRRRMDGLRRIRDALSEPIPELERIDLVPRLREAVAIPVVHSSHWRWTRGSWPAAAGALAAAAGVALLLARGPLAESNSQPGNVDYAEFRAKGVAIQGSRRETWVGLKAYRVEREGKPQRLGEHLQATDGLVFSYNNLGREPYRYLMVFGVDAHGEVRWYYPAHDTAGTNPQSIPIESGKAEQPLPEVVRHEYFAGPLLIHGLFTDQPLDVTTVETMIREKADGLTPLELPGSAEQILRTSVATIQRSKSTVRHGDSTRPASSSAGVE